MLEVGDIVHACDTSKPALYGFITKIKEGKGIYVEWFNGKHDSNGWFWSYMVEKVHHASSW